MSCFDFLHGLRSLLTRKWTPFRYMAVAASLPIFASLPNSGCGGTIENLLIPTGQEVEMGEQFSKEIEKEIKLYKDPEVVKYIQELGQSLVKVSKRTDIAYEIKVVDTDEVNAFALPGGFLYVNRGLISTAENESELAGVMGHEIGHVVGRHGVRQMTRQIGLELITSLVIGDNPGMARQLAGQFAGIGGAIGMLKYSRNAEREADALAIQEIYDAGIDPMGMATFFEKLKALHDENPTGFAALFTTHPAPAERITNAKRDITALPKKAGLRKDSERFQRIKKRLPALKPVKKK
ncbi:MAG: M48 family metalloprotease [candidate division Zixibacteria bacterium]|nr:M48 family metalloprotease [candidate division Zixibacteria bacterium]